jgi:hypothetical protein
MQLFNIGTVLLNEDGTRQRDADGKEIEAYSNLDIMNFARKFVFGQVTYPRVLSQTSWLIKQPYCSQVRGLDLMLRSQEATLRCYMNLITPLIR